MIASWPGPDPAIHVYRAPPGVDHRVKPGDDDFLFPIPLLLGQGEGTQNENPLIEVGPYSLPGFSWPHDGQVRNAASP